MKTIPQQRQHGIETGQRGHVLLQGFAMQAQYGGRQGRVQGRNLQFESHAPFGSITPVEMIAVQ